MLIFAHRGASADAPENTLRAISVALDQQADGIEIDVYQLEQELVVIHDRWVHRTTNGQGQLSTYTLESLQTLDAGSGEKVPTLWQVLELVSGRCYVNIEVKGLQSIELLTNYLSRAVNQLGFTFTQLLVSSFDHHLLKQIKQQNSQLLLGALTASKPLHYAEFAEQLGAYSVNADMTFLDQHFVDDAHQRGLKVFVYTVDEQLDLQLLKQWGVDGVFANAPAKARAYLC